MIVSADAENRRLDDVIVVLVTSASPTARSFPTEVLIDVSTPEGRASNLLHTSVVKCHRIATIHKHLIQRTVGRVPPPLMARIDAALKVALELP